MTGDGENDPLLARHPGEPQQRLAVDVLHDEEKLAALRDDVDGLDDVRVADARDDARLVQEHRDEVRIPGVALVKALDGDDAREAGGSDLPCEVHGGHASGRNFAAEGVPPSDGAAQRTFQPRLLYSVAPVAAGRALHPPTPTTEEPLRFHEVARSHAAVENLWSRFAQMFSELQPPDLGNIDIRAPT